MSKNRNDKRFNDQQVQDATYRDADESAKQAVPEAAPETPAAEEPKREKSIHIGPITVSFESAEARKMRKQQAKAEKAAKPKKGISVPVLVAGTIITGTAIKEGARLVMKIVDRKYGPSLPEAGEDPDCYSDDSIGDGTELVEENAQEE